MISRARAARRATGLPPMDCRRRCWRVSGFTGRDGHAARPPAAQGQRAAINGVDNGSGEQGAAHARQRVAPIPGKGGVAVRPAHPPADRAPSQAGRGQVIAPRIGLEFTWRLTFDAWADIGRQLAAMLASSAWCLGDWLIYGQRVSKDRYRAAVEQTGLDYQTLRNYAWVARRFELPRRHGALAFGHHAEVAALPEPEQDFWLRKAEQFGWSTSQLRREVRASLRERGERADAIEPPDPAELSQDGPGQP